MQDLIPPHKRTVELTFEIFSHVKKSHLGFVKESKKVIMMEKSLILRQILGMLCLLISYSKFTQPIRKKALKPTERYAMVEVIKAYISEI